MKYLLLVTVFFYKTETKQIDSDGFGFGRTFVHCDTGRVNIKPRTRFHQTDSTITIQKYGVLKTYYWYKIQ